MSVIRAFIAIELPHDIQTHLEEISSQLKDRLKDVPIRWVPVENIHLTLKFLGNVSLESLEMLTEVMQTVAVSHQTFEISVGGLGAYPKEHRPRVIWIGVEAPAVLHSTMRSLEAETARLGYALEERPFSPHLTLGRIARNATTHENRSTAEVITTYKVGFLGVARVHSLNLFRSDLKPSGAVYTCLFTADLGGES